MKEKSILKNIKAENSGYKLRNEVMMTSDLFSKIINQTDESVMKVYYKWKYLWPNNFIFFLKYTAHK